MRLEILNWLNSPLRIYWFRLFLIEHIVPSQSQHLLPPLCSLMSISKDNNHYLSMLFMLLLSFPITSTSCSKTVEAQSGASDIINAPERSIISRWRAFCRKWELSFCIVGSRKKKPARRDTSPSIISDWRRLENDATPRCLAASQITHRFIYICNKSAINMAIKVG